MCVKDNTSNVKMLDVVPAGVFCASDTVLPGSYHCSDCVA